ncbi:peroxiredoxin [Allonocardiopsis opalescens]|uniref:Alkyl hydroperoxide reductase E n=1 Tax=Allonocardiopsis opalescens TaxID=1144618 RepID=A0A2T0PUA2_9ACTN|nr:peroxiredoxin [Allonocardiopsis opalescens]PRX92479.1 peroxiredoxin [Allonocardiopsis opalescens]
MSVEVGQSAPEFELQDQHGQPVRLADFQGVKNVLVVFYPLAFSGVCTNELCDIKEDIGAFVNDSTQLLAISVDSVFTHRAWADQESLEFPLLSDFWPHGEVARAYGVFDEEKGIALRGSFLVDTDGIVRWKVVNPISQPRDLDDYHKALAELS